MCDLEGQILSDPDCLRAGCKLDDLICPPPKGFVTREGKKTAPHLAQPWHFQVKEVNSEFSVFSDYRFFVPKNSLRLVMFIMKTLEDHMKFWWLRFSWTFWCRLDLSFANWFFLALGAVRRHLWLKFGVSGEALEALWETTLGHDRSFVPKSMSTAIAGGTTFFNQVLI